MLYNRDPISVRCLEVQATLAALRELFPTKRITVVFQPHLYSRTRLLLDEFSSSFVDADRVIVTDIFAAREAPDSSIHAKDLVSRIKETGTHATYIEDFLRVPDLLCSRELKTDVLLIERAGSIGMLADRPVA